MAGKPQKSTVKSVPQPTKPAWQEWAETIVISVLLAAFIMTFVARSYAVVGSSMFPTLHNGERLMVDKLSYRFGNPQRGDIVILHPPILGSEPFVKRVIGLPGDQILVKDGKAYLNGKPLNEPYIAERIAGEFGPYVVPPGNYFVMGDNRNHSEDSRFSVVGFIPKDQIVGRAIFRYWPVNTLTLVHRPAVY